MATFTKTILPPDTYHSPDGTLVVTPKRAKHWYAEFVKAKASNLRIPMGWDHSENKADLLPLRKRDYEKKVSAKNTLGHLSNMKLLDGGKGGLELTVEVSDPVAIGKIERNEVFVSPVVWDEPFSDGRGTNFKDFFGCMDLVNYPVDQNQGPFMKAEAGMVACALRLGLDTKVYRLAADDTPPDETPDEPDPDMPPTDENDDKDGQQLKSIIAHLAELGAVMPSDTDSDNFMDRLQPALMTLLKAKQDADADSDNEDDEMPEVKDTSPAFAAMSLRVKELEAQTLQNRKDKQADRRDKIALSLDGLLKEGKIKPPDVEKLTKSVGAIKLSLDAPEEDLLSRTELEISVREQLPRGSFWDPDTKLRMSSVEDTKLPPFARDSENPTDEEAEELVDALFAKKRRATK